VGFRRNLSETVLLALKTMGVFEKGWL